MLRLVRSINRHAEIVSLLLCELRQFNTNLFEMQTSHFLVELLWQTIDTGLVSVLVLPEIDLCEDLV